MVQISYSQGITVLIVRVQGMVYVYPIIYFIIIEMFNITCGTQGSCGSPCNQAK